MLLLLFFSGEFPPPPSSLPFTIPPASSTQLSYSLLVLRFLSGPNSPSSRSFISVSTLTKSSYRSPSYRKAKIVKPITTSGWLNWLALLGTSFPTKGMADSFLLWGMFFPASIWALFRSPKFTLSTLLSKNGAKSASMSWHMLIICGPILNFWKILS